MPLVITKSMSKFLKVNEEVKQLVMSPIAKRTRLSKRHGRSKRQKKPEQSVTLSVLAKPTDGCVNGKNRSRFPDPCQDRSILLAVIDSEQNFLRLNYLSNDGELHPDEGSDKDGYSSCQYFVLLEKIERKYTTDNRTEVYSYPSNDHVDNFMYANLQDHTIVDKCLPDGVAGYWIRAFGEPSVFILTIALWKWTGSSKKSKQNINTCSDCLRRLGEVKVEFCNVLRTEPKQKEAPQVQGTKPFLDSTSLLKESANNGIIKTLRTFRNNGMVKEFDFACKSFLRTSEEHKNKDSCVIVMLEQSLFYSQQANPSQAKRVLQSAVELASKARHSAFLLNRTYLYLATVHVNDGTTGTAEECLAMVKKDNNLGLPEEDIGLYYILKGTIYMKFGEKIEGFAEKLWVEAKAMFMMALSELAQSDDCQALTVEAHFCLAKLFLVIAHAKSSKRIPSTNAIAFEDVDDLLRMANEHLSSVRTLDDSDFSERIQIRYSILQAECYLASITKGDQRPAAEEGYWSAEPAERAQTNPFSDSNQEEEQYSPAKSQTPTSEISGTMEQDNVEEMSVAENEVAECSKMSTEDNQSGVEHFGLVISSRKCSPVELQDDEVASASEDAAMVSSSTQDLAWPSVQRDVPQYDQKSTQEYLQSARSCLQKAESCLQNALFTLEKKDFERVSLILNQIEKTEQVAGKVGKGKLRKLSASVCDSGYEADCSSLDGVQLGSVYEQTTYV